jgi:hypothetical protein
MDSIYGSIYHDGVQNTMTEIWPSGQNIIWYIDPRVDFSGVQNTI